MTIGLKVGGKIRSAAAFESFNGPNVFFHVAMERPTSEFLKLCHWYPFEYLKCHRMTCMVSSLNKKAIRAAEHIGFKKECVLEDAAPLGDIVVMKILETDFKLGAKHGIR